jgi:hypothetical protein
MGRSSPPRVFAAPLGLAVRLTTFLPFPLLMGTAVFIGWQVPEARERTVALTLLAGVLPLVFAGIALFSYIAGYELADGSLTIRRLGRRQTLPLEGLTDVRAEPEAARRAWRVVGNDGLGAIIGRFRNRRLGAFEAYLTDKDRTVVLRWPDRTVVVSPDDPAAFAAEVRRRTGLRG